MAFAFALDPAVPAGGEAAALGDDRIREFKNAVIERVNSRFVSIEGDPWILKSPASGGNVQALVPTADNTYALGTAALRFANSFFVALTMGGANPALVGQVRLPNDNIISWRNQANTADLSLRVNTANNFLVDSDFAVLATRRIYIDGGGNSYIHERAGDAMEAFVGGIRGWEVTPTLMTLGTAQDFVIHPLKRLYLDGLSDTYIYEATANRIDLVAGGGARLLVGNTIVSVSNVPMSLEPTHRLYFDGGVDTYLHEISANRVDLVTGGATAWAASSSFFYVVGRSLYIDAAQSFYLDGGSDTYIRESSANIIDFVNGGVNRFRIISDGVATNGNRLYLDVGSDTYMSESAANVITFTVGAANAFRISGTFTESISVDHILSATKRLYLDGGSDTYIVESAANQARVVTGGAIAMIWYNNQNVSLEPGKILYLDGGSDSGIDEVSANNIRIFAGGTESVRFTPTGMQVRSGTEIRRVFSTVFNWNPANCVAHSQQATTATVTGAVVGDTVILTSSAVGSGGINTTLDGFVSAADTVTLVLQNNDTVDVDLAAFDVRITVIGFA